MKFSFSFLLASDAKFISKLVWIYLLFTLWVFVVYNTHESNFCVAFAAIAQLLRIENISWANNG